MGTSLLLDFVGICLTLAFLKRQRNGCAGALGPNSTAQRRALPMRRPSCSAVGEKEPRLERLKSELRYGDNQRQSVSSEEANVNMDPLTAFSVAGTVIQFVDFGMKLISTTAELYWSADGALAVNKELDMAITDLSSVGKKLSHQGSLGPDIEEICTKTDALATELLKKLEGLKVRGRNRVWTSFHQAVKAAWSHEELDRLKERMETLRRVLDTNVLVSLREAVDHISLQTSQRFDNLDKQTQQIITSLLGNSNAVSLANIERQTLATMQVLSRMEVGKANTELVTSTSTLDTTHLLEEPDVQSPFREAMLAPSMVDERKTRALVSRYILESLSFPSMTNRYEQVGEAYSETLGWIFRESTDATLAFSNFVDWLSKTEQNGLYWIKGKAGSGKSTLMRFLVDDPRTTRYLGQWADTGPLPLCMATYFFWNSGSADQKSQEGLLRSLLHQVLSEHPQLLPTTLPSLWASYYSRAVSWQPLLKQAWTLPGLLTAFENLVKQTSHPLRLCFLVDGLDELDGDHEQLSETFKRVSALDNVKICVSSRPWVVFEDCFRGFPRLRLQDLTQIDIEHYIRQKIENHASFRNLALEYPADTAKLVTDITEKADGVFLWVTIVVRSLLIGLRNRDSVQDLQRRLLQFPRDLEPLYRHMLSLIEDVYAESSSQIFQIAKAVRETEAVWEEIQPLTALRLYFAVHPEVEGRSRPASLETLSEEMEIQLTARCAGLLEIIQSHSEGNRVFGDGEVVYLHRTARDFVESPAVWQELLSRTATTDFHPVVSMVRSGVSQLSWRYKLFEGSQDDSLRVEVMRYAYQAELETDLPQTIQLDKLAEVMPGYYKSQQFSLTKDLSGYYPSGIPTGLLVVAMQWDLAAYICEKVQNSKSSSLPELATILLQNINLPMNNPASNRRNGQLEISSRTGLVLLKIGARPNRKYKGLTPWERFMYQFRKESSDLSLQPRTTERGIAYRRSALQVITLCKQFVASGADLNVSVTAFGRTFTAEDIVRSSFQRLLVDGETSDLAQEMHRLRTGDSVPKEKQPHAQQSLSSQHLELRDRSLRSWLRRKLLLD
ncbi:hypothetical protein L207DRAFT_560602 [Hyaloscypha variabilis F]|uniref:NACHT domain-containing protein n=1 Tax=Hyaloscypha variabilis (strain UAMH 11265 / GT02V1 / F) TaxID=1149755 RepID=A0A2J6S858_HYAVF|nr:hypothetical protein L207DRAFT_560602 [Hyaloscypha variabilis F]